VTSVQFAPDGKAVLSCSVDASARVFDLPRAEATATGHSDRVNSVAVSRDGKHAATGSGDRTVKVWDLATGREVATLTGEAESKSSSVDSGILAVVFVGNDKVAASGHERVLRTWTFQPNKLLDNPRKLKEREPAFFLAADPDGKTVGAAWVDSNVGMEKTKAGFELYAGGDALASVEVASKSAADATTAATLSPDAKWGVIGGADGVISIWDVAKKERIGGDWPILNNARVADIGVTPDRKTVVVIDENGEVKVGDTAKRAVTASVKAVEPLGGGDMKGMVDVRGVVVAPTADTFATLSGDGTVKAWGMDCKEVRTWKLPHAPTCAVFTADGKRLITGNQDGTAFVLELPAK
jgi:WD40 repeat protein